MPVIFGGAGLRRTAAAVFAATCLLSSQFAVAEDEDLDKLPPEEVRAALEAELDDVFADKTPANTKAELVADFERVLHDAGDTGDARESVISWDELVHEMEEAHTTVHAVVVEAVDEALKEPEAPPEPKPDEPDEPGGERQSLGLKRIKAAYNSVLASLFNAIEKS